MFSSSGYASRFCSASLHRQRRSGAFDYLVVFACVGDAIKVVLLEEFFYGVTVESVTPERITVTGGHWTREDSNCCPSGNRQIVYDWSPEDFGYVSAERTIPKALLQ